MVMMVVGVVVTTMKIVMMIAKLTLSRSRVINFTFLLQPHQKYYITQYEELGF